MALSEQTQRDIAEHGRTIIVVSDHEEPENNLQFSYTVGNAIGDNPTQLSASSAPENNWLGSEPTSESRLEIKPLSP